VGGSFECFAGAEFDLEKVVFEGELDSVDFGFDKGETSNSGENVREAAENKGEMIVEVLEEAAKNSGKNEASLKVAALSGVDFGKIRFDPVLFKRVVEKGFFGAGTEGFA